MIATIEQLDFNKTYTYADYLSWKFSDYVELLKGKIYQMAAPSVKHQRVSSKFHVLLGQYLWTKKCEVFHAPFDVRLAKTDGSISVVQPDICVICDPAKLDDAGCNGAPDLIIEILSPGNTKKEMKIKYEIYEEAGVKEYWLVSLSEKTILQYILGDNGKYSASRPLTDEDIIITAILPDLQINLEDVFRNI